MPIVTIPKKYTQDDLVVISRREYETLRDRGASKEFKPTTTQKQALKRAEANFDHGQLITYDELVEKLAASR